MTDGVKTKEESFQPKKHINVKFQFIKLSVYREYLHLEFKGLKLPFEYNLENIIDDFILLCFLVGNDFMPKLPGFKIREGGIDCLLFIYKRVLPFMNGYLTNVGDINLNRLDIYLHELAKVEQVFLKQEKKNA